ncbi:hypothetical protein BMA10247_A1186 [Burkholderia mallei NCTC 10247]|uniref:Uncharacterized protein n=2 Tax=Burkholderia pseudomallei TaxID=28450 RepID=A0A0E1VYA1_BURPE|nr:hypothetical protein BURPS668_A1531 [Burkholderia pseudomallei 668]ABN94083.1 hypothetical protein BURPS1106A_A1445 [Burkholderia pseudomallei 1106a]ABO02638.1 hypothetical protein BMA10247_A1186 [Burkholderia mallei NCTC 10247]AFR19379.1 hypothetical protein BPC006_II1452 [Burkholderia pseudomallei BPC006]EBA45266.1 hypothetical protein BURPS305_0954 [Burkholderia pseudomallei 305]EDS82710.1 hypothetical protein BURPSS13_T0562 [Burkholderia pseudomallei S13]EEC38179.1 conserved hypothetic
MTRSSSPADWNGPFGRRYFAHNKENFMFLRRRSRSAV